MKLRTFLSTNSLTLLTGMMNRALTVRTGFMDKFQLLLLSIPCGALEATDLFQPFERGSAKAAGTGLGLSIVRAIAEGHDGKASLRAGDGGIGAIATIEIPLKEGHAA